jgi:hypothetical protein
LPEEEKTIEQLTAEAEEMKEKKKKEEEAAKI